MPPEDFDVVIVGGGLVGLSLTCALADSGLQLALVDRAGPLVIADPPGDWDVRVYALSPGSEAFLRSCAAWPEAASERIAPVVAMEVLGDTGTGRIAFDAHAARVAHLAQIVENRLLLDALWRAAQRQSSLTVIAPAQCRSLAFEEGVALLTLDSEGPVRGKLLVAADGAQSWLRAEAGMAASIIPYQQSAVVANFACEQPHRNTAFQWFRRDGVLALLPLPGNRCSMVWSAEQDLADELMAAPGEDLASRVAEASGGRLGRLERITASAAFSLQLIRLPQLVRARLALVGDAAHNLHPLAGQGVNLGFQDARELAQVLLRRGSCHDVGEHRLLRRYERARREDILAMTWMTDGLQRLFNNGSPRLSWMRNRGLTLADRAGPIKQFLIRHALG